jgi:thiol-disulfide isomerase/thioredoxin
MRKLFPALLFLATIANAKPLDGTWRAVLASPGGELPFGLRFAGGGAEVINGPERVKVSGVSVDGKRVTIRFDWYDSAIRATLSDDGNSMTGAWTRTVPSRTARMPFRATRGVAPRFAPAPQASSSLASVAGIWKATFTDADGTSPARGEFHQDRGSTRVTGTFLTPTGDYRYLEGSFENGLLRLSTFDGAHAFLFQARAASDGTLAGDFWQRDAYHATWTASRDAAATLPDGWSDVNSADAQRRFRFAFPDLDGKLVSSHDPRFRGKVVLVNIFGSWCPNCNDEAPLLAAWDRKYRAKGLEVVGLAYEFTGDAARDREMVRRFAKRYGIKYTLLLAGVSDKKKASATLPSISGVLAYPTSIFIGRDGRVRKIYSGFAGPGTGAHFDHLRREFEREIAAALEEK